MRRLWLLVFAACGGGGADIDPDTDDGNGLAPPDVTGSYLATLTEQAGCASEVPPLDWADGPLEITGNAPALTFGFGAVALDGAVDASFTWTIADSATVEGWTLDVSAEGLAYIDDDLWVLEGDMTVDALSPEGATCTLTGLLVAREL